MRWILTVERSTSDGWFQEENHLIGIRLETIYEHTAPPDQKKVADRAAELIGKTLLVKGTYAVVVPTSGAQIIPTVTFKAILKDADNMELDDIALDGSSSTGRYEFECRFRFQASSAV